MSHTERSDASAEAESAASSHTGAAVIVERALERSRDVQDQVKSCASDLDAVNTTVARNLGDDTTGSEIHDALETSRTIESKVRQSADDLNEVNESLADGVVELRQTRDTLEAYRAALADTEAALASSRAAEARARRLAFVDATTGLPNRALFDDRLSQAISMAQRNAWTLAILFFDLDRFKLINDTHGHAAGDGVLKEVARRLQLHCRDTDTLCRHGGDEFLYLLMNPSSRDRVSSAAAKVITAIARPIHHGGLQLRVQASVGIALFPEHAAEPQQLIDHADTAMYRAKREACGYCFY